VKCLVSIVMMYAPRGPFESIVGGSAASGRGPLDQLEYLDGVAKALIVLNLLDAVFTLYWIRAGLATEWNTLMRDLVVENAFAFVAVKLALVSLGAFWLLRFRRYKLVAAGLLISLVSYVAVVFHHVRFLGLLSLSSL